MIYCLKKYTVFRRENPETEKLLVNTQDDGSGPAKTNGWHQKTKLSCIILKHLLNGTGSCAFLVIVNEISWRPLLPALVERVRKAGRRARGGDAKMRLLLVQWRERYWP